MYTLTKSDYMQTETSLASNWC